MVGEMQQYVRNTIHKQEYQLNAFVDIYRMLYLLTTQVVLVALAHPQEHLTNASRLVHRRSPAIRSLRAECNGNSSYCKRTSPG